jgi:hypothetical protein
MQTVFKGNLGAPNFPLVSSFEDQTVAVPQYDENSANQRFYQGSYVESDMDTPQVYYMHNVMPDSQGYKSIAYKRTIKAPVVPDNTFDQMFTVHDANENRALLAHCTNGNFYIFVPGNASWKQIQIPGWTGGPITTAAANGNTYICLSKFGVYKVDITNEVLSVVNLAGMTMASIISICSANNYLIVTDGTVVYWSNATNPEDFVPSLVTGAGSVTPNDLAGTIVGIFQLNNGFVVYTVANIIAASFSGNIRYPWIFKSDSNSSGILNVKDVTNNVSLGEHYAWTAAGLLRVTGQGCTPEFGEVTDFLSGRIFEDYDDVANTFSTQYLSTPLLVKPAYIGSRFLVISYGVTSYTHALVFDVALKRWGKLRINHVDCFEITINNDGNGVPWTGLAGTSWSQLQGNAWQDLITLTNSAPSAKRTLAFLQADGMVQTAIFDYGNFTSDACIIFGKYQLVRTNLCSLNAVSLENLDINNGNVNIAILTTLDGKTYLTPPLVPTNEITSAQVRKYNCRKTGLNHALVITGAFHLVSIELTFAKHGRR